MGLAGDELAALGHAGRPGRVELTGVGLDPRDGGSSAGEAPHEVPLTAAHVGHAQVRPGAKVVQGREVIHDAEVFHVSPVPRRVATGCKGSATLWRAWALAGLG